MKRIAWITLGLSMAACTASSTTSPATEQDYEDTAQAIASSTAASGRSGGGLGGGDVIAIGDAVSLARGVLPLGFLRGSDGHFRGNHLGVDHNFTVTCKDAAGAVQTACDKTTDSATIELEMTGNLDTPNLTASIDREGTWTITGLQSDTASMDGNSSFTLDTTMKSIFHEGVTSTFMFENTAVYTAITISTADRQITGGSATFDVKAHRTVTGTEMGAHDVDKSFEIHAELTFNADHTATLVLDGTRTFTIDLRSGGCHKGRSDGPRS